MRTPTQRARRILTQYLAVTSAVYLLGVVSARLLDASGHSLFDGEAARPTGSETGGIIAVLLGVAGILVLYLSGSRVDPRTLTVGLLLASAATPVVMAFHVQAAAEMICITAAMFLAMLIRAFRPTVQARWWVATLTVAVCGALILAPAPKSEFIYLIAVVGVVGASEIFGSLARNLADVASRDPLTGLRNRAGFEIAAAEQMRGLPRQAPVSMIVIDLDGFKQVNDTQGHIAGDELLQTLAQGWAAELRAGELIARMGGDEFVVLFAGATPAQALVRMADLRRTHLVGWSFGVAGMVAGGDAAQLYREADADLYRRRRERQLAENRGSSHG